MRKNIHILFLFLFAFLLGNCAGLKTITIESQEPAQVTLPKNVRSLLVVNNVVTQPDNYGHYVRLWKNSIDTIAISLDSIGIYYTEALSQFLEEEQYFDKVLYYNKPLRTDSNFLDEKPIMPDEMLQFRKEHGVDAVISLDRLIVTSDTSLGKLITNSEKNNKRQESDNVYFDDSIYIQLKIQSVVRIHMPTPDGEVLAIHYADSITYEGYNVIDIGKTTTDNTSTAMKNILSKYERGLSKLFVITAAEKMTKTLSPYWEMQERWFYTLPNAMMRKGGYYANQRKWDEALVKWQEFFNSDKKAINRAKAASNIALAYEMKHNLPQAYKWIAKAYILFEESVSPNSFDLKRTLLYKNELDRRYKNEGALKFQVPQTEKL